MRQLRAVEGWDGGEDRNTSLPGFDSLTNAVQRHVWGTKAKPSGVGRWRLCCFERRSFPRRV
jgi:hypothetical protein